MSIEERVSLGAAYKHLMHRQAWIKLVAGKDRRTAIHLPNIRKLHIRKFALRILVNAVTGEVEITR
jgi:hypothetical protein